MERVGSIAQHLVRWWQASFSPPVSTRASGPVVASFGTRIKGPKPVLFFTFLVLFFFEKVRTHASEPKVCVEVFVWKLISNEEAGQIHPCLGWLGHDLTVYLHR